jgi:hypothetical protein
MTTMRRIRRRFLPVALALTALAACQSGDHAGLGPDVRRGLENGREAASAWIVTGRTDIEVEASTAIAVGYLERLRLGLGSPFRLIDMAVHDPRLDATQRGALGWALLARTLDRDAYQVPDAVLDRIVPAARGKRPTLGREHLELIDNAIRESRDPRSGEVAVRLAYAFAAAEGSLVSQAPEIGARVAALVRDRELARSDAIRLLRAAQDQVVDPFALLPRWRAERRFEVEQPPMAVLSAELEREALELAPRLARAFRELTPRSLDAPDPRYDQRSASLLGVVAATRLAAIADSFNAPAQTPIVISTRLYRNELLEAPGVTEAERARRENFLESAINEERFAAELARLHRTGRNDAAPALAAVSAAVALRAYAQEPVWFPGFGGPSTRELLERYGLASIRFSDDVPAEWRPYYRRMVDMAFADLYRVLPALDLEGLSLLFNDGSGQEATLAMHDPRARRLLLPAATAAGTIAHEVAHDLDWQVALRRYHVRGDYATDRATRSRSDRLALRLQDLANASLDANRLDERTSDHARRPAEVFARNIDWFVAVSLAAEGRINGYLTSVQDDMLTGYGTVRPPDITGAAGRALVNILDEVAPLYPATRDWFLKSYGPQRSLTPYDLVRRVLESNRPDRRDSQATHPLQLATSTASAVAFQQVEQAREAGFEAIESWICRSPGAAYDPDLELARRSLVLETARARARGLALDRANELGGQEGRRWVERQLYGPPWPATDADSAVVEVLQPLLNGVHDVARLDVDVAPKRFVLSTPPDHCAAAPFRLN